MFETIPVLFPFSNVADMIVDAAAVCIVLVALFFSRRNRRLKEEIREHQKSDARRDASFGLLFDHNPVPMWLFDRDTLEFLAVNETAIAQYGYSREQFMTMHVTDMRPGDSARTAEYIRALPESQTEANVGQHKRADGTLIDVAVFSRLLDYEGREARLVAINDVTERRQAERRIAHMALSDPLTELPNRAAFNRRLDATLKSAEARQKNFAVLCIDLNGFKEVNDNYGHALGDMLLCQVADRLRAVCGGTFVARLGGDEFAVITEDENRSGAAALAGRILDAFVDDFEVGDNRLWQSLSISAAMYPVHGADVMALMNNADAALYRAKAEAPGSVQFFKTEMAKRLNDRTALQLEFKSAIQRDELQLHYQPQFKVTGEITGFEALARWHSVKRGMVPPNEFIPLAESSSLILVLGEWALREACREAAGWKRPLSIAVNVSPMQFRHGDLPRLVHSILLETGLVPHRLELEVTESLLIGDISRAVSILGRLKSLGVQIVLDDFGTGYSSLAYLRAFPFDKIKIDRSFISELGRDRQSIIIVRAVIGLARNLKIPILAEGVETPAQLAVLAQEGCEEVQGYLTGRPLAIEKYASLVSGKTMTPATTLMKAQAG